MVIWPGKGRTLARPCYKAAVCIFSLDSKGKEEQVFFPWAFRDQWEKANSEMITKRRSSSGHKTYAHRVQTSRVCTPEEDALPSGHVNKPGRGRTDAPTPNPYHYPGSNPIGFLSQRGM